MWFLWLKPLFEIQLPPKLQTLRNCYLLPIKPHQTPLTSNYSLQPQLLGSYGVCWGLKPGFGTQCKKLVLLCYHIPKVCNMPQRDKNEPNSSSMDYMEHRPWINQSFPFVDHHRQKKWVLNFFTVPFVNGFNLKAPGPLMAFMSFKLNYFSGIITFQRRNFSLRGCQIFIFNLSICSLIPIGIILFIALDLTGKKMGWLKSQTIQWRSLFINRHL